VDAAPSAQVQQILDYLKDVPVIENESYFILPAFHFMRATPWQVVQQGGDCADRSRLMIVLLRLHGIRASKWALYSPEMKPVHAVVQVQTELGPMVADTLFGITYPRPEGGFYSISELREDPLLYRQRVEALQATHARPGGEKLESYPLNRYVFDHARTINWEKSEVMHLMYRGLHGIMGDRIDGVGRPFFAEQPALMVILLIAFAEAVLLLLWAFVKRLKRKSEQTGIRQSTPRTGMAIQ
jgi:hypothetical protein